MQVFAQWPAHQVKNIPGKCLCSNTSELGFWWAIFTTSCPKLAPSCLVLAHHPCREQHCNASGCFPPLPGKMGQCAFSSSEGVIRNRDWGLRREHWAQNPVCVPAFAPIAHTVNVTQLFTHQASASLVQAVSKCSKDGNSFSQKDWLSSQKKKTPFSSLFQFHWLLWLKEQRRGKRNPKQNNFNTKTFQHQDPALSYWAPQHDLHTASFWDSSTQHWQSVREFLTLSVTKEPVVQVTVVFPSHLKPHITPAEPSALESVYSRTNH